jgi:hypothetical protein
MVEVIIKSNIADLRSQFAELSEDAFQGAISKAINRQLTPSKNLAIKDICKVYNIPEDVLRQKTVIQLKYSGKRSLTGQILVNTKPISLNVFDPVETKEGVELEIKRGEKTVIKGAFMGFMPNGGYGVFGRGDYDGGKFDWRHARVVAGGKSVVVKNTRRPEKNDLTINNLKSVSAYTSFVRPAVLAALDNRLNEQLPRRLALELTKASRTTD